MVAVRLRGRPWTAVVSDMIEGVVAANRLVGAEADGIRRALWLCLEAEALLPPAPPPPPAVVKPTMVPGGRTAPRGGTARSRPRAAPASPPHTEAA